MNVSCAIQLNKLVQDFRSSSTKNVIDSGAEVLIAGNVGPKAYSVLRASGVEVYVCDVMPVSQAIAEYKAGKLIKASEATVESHW